MNKPLVSVIVPSYNSEKYIKETMDSILGQTYANIEVIVMDGLSKDATLDILKAYGDRIKVISEKDKGQTNAINKGFEIASGEFIGWIGSDDILMPYDVEIVVEEFLKDVDTALVYGDIEGIDEKGKFIANYSKPNISKDRLLFEDPAVVQPGSFFRKTLLDKCGKLDENLNCVMDYDIWLRIADYGKIVHIPKILAKFRLHSNSKTVSMLAQFSKEIIKVGKSYGVKWYHKSTLGCRKEILKSYIKK